MDKKSSISANSTNIKKWIIIIAIDIVILISLILFGIFQPWFHTKVKIDGIFIEQPRAINDFNLLDHHGNPFTKARLQGHWTLLFFGFTHCQMVCPATFDALNKTLLLLQKQLPADLLPQVVFISIDPKEDTPARLKQYINSYNPNFIGVRGTLSKTTALEKKLSNSAVRINDVITHSTDILVLNPRAEIQAYFLYPHRPQNMARDYELIVTQIP